MIACLPSLPFQTELFQGRGYALYTSVPVILPLSKAHSRCTLPQCFVNRWPRESEWVFMKWNGDCLWGKTGGGGSLSWAEQRSNSKGQFSSAHVWTDCSKDSYRMVPSEPRALGIVMHSALTTIQVMLPASCHLELAKMGPSVAGLHGRLEC